MHKKRLPILGSPLICSFMDYFSNPELVAQRRLMISIMHMEAATNNGEFNETANASNLSNDKISVHGRQ
jgi:hypothetical protein